MLRKLKFSKPLLVLSALILAAMACYSDSPLWFGGELTEPPPSPTFIPTPDANNPAKYQIGDKVTGLRTNSPFLYLTDFPIPETVANRSRENCNFGRAYEVLYSGYDKDNVVYYLIACQGSVGWSEEDRLTGPIKFDAGNSAYTLPIDANGNPIPDTMPNFAIHNQEPVPNQNPPVFGPATTQCEVNQVVDVVGLKAIDASTTWYQIDCGNNVFGWVDQTRLFGPLFFSDDGGIGLVNPAIDVLPLTANPEPVSGDNTIAECPGDSVITTTALQLIDEVPYYEITCGDVSGWTIQDDLIELAYAPDSFIVVHVEETVVTSDEGETTDATADTPPADEGADAADVVLAAALTENPGPVDTAENPQIGECASESIAYVDGVTYAGFEFYYHIDCGNEQVGWLDGSYALMQVGFPADGEVAITDAGIIGLTSSERAFYVSDEPKRIAGARGASGACESNSLATIADTALVQTASGPQFYYLVTCTSTLGTELQGWVDQNRLQPAEILSDSGSATPTDNVFGG